MPTLPNDTMLHDAGIPLERVAVRHIGSAKKKLAGAIVYWMQASQRATWNHALEYAILAAHANPGTPLFVIFILDPRDPSTMGRHGRFMLQGLADVAKDLSQRDIAFCLISGDTLHEVTKVARHASLLVTDRGYMRQQVAWRQSVMDAVSCTVVEVESDVVVPLETASDHEEYAARTIRPKIIRALPRMLLPLRHQRAPHHKPELPYSQTTSTDIEHVMKALFSDEEAAPLLPFQGGASAAHKRLTHFLENGLTQYDHANDPTADAVSLLSPYLHYGHISPLEITLAIGKTEQPQAEAFLEQLIIRRELAMNFVYYQEHYDSPACLPSWTVRTLQQHAHDPRPYRYSLSVFEAAATHDDAWNAAQLQMIHTGHMAGYMRMYWGKKVIEWSSSWEEAYRTLVFLNDRYELDGRDPNGYAGIAWCFGKHDRPWKERDIFGTIRYMNAAGLRRKFDIDAYIHAMRTYHSSTD